MRKYFKYIVIGFKENLSRFIAVIAIVALGVGFLVGLLSAAPTLYQSMDKMYDDRYMMDLNVKSTVGFHRDTIERIKNENTECIGVYQSEQKIEIHEQKMNSRQISYDLKDTSINTLLLKAGRFPQNQFECVALTSNRAYSQINMGFDFMLGEDKYTVVGIVESPVFFAKEKEYNETTAGRVDFIFYTDSTFYDYPITDLWIKYKDLVKYNSFKKIYFTELSKHTEQLKEIQVEELNRQMASFPRMGDMVPEWHILDRNSNLSYMGYIQNVEKINKIAIVFPAFFYFIAALVALTTITRMVEEERTTIGLFKALGYSKNKIACKYVTYSGICSFFGVILGVVLGIFVLPYVIYVAFNTLYRMPQCQFVFEGVAILVASLIMVLTIEFVAVYVSIKILKEKPSALLLPKAPKSGKRILLERIPILWKKIKFKYKNTFRNIFRYKKNMIMMMIGIGGCVALLLCAFGLRSAIGEVGDLQYKKIELYDFKITSGSSDWKPEGEVLSAYVEEVYLEKDSKYEIEFIQVNTKLDGFIELRNKKNKKISFKEGDIVVTKQIAEHFKIKKGSVISILDREYKVKEICKNHIGNAIYYYNDDLKETNTYFTFLPEDMTEEEYVEKILLANPNVQIEQKADLMQSFSSMSGSLSLIVFVVILCSGALAIIVIYNLTNININERIKEIATLRVIGYQYKEVCGYIFREIFLLSLIGILFGFCLGPILFYFISYHIQNPGLQFNYMFHPIYFLYAFGITLVFIGIVDALFIPKIKHIPMAESLKFVD